MLWGQSMATKFTKWTIGIYGYEARDQILSRIRLSEKVSKCFEQH